MDDRGTMDEKALFSWKWKWKWKETLLLGAGLVGLILLIGSLTDNEAVRLLVPVAAFLVGIAWISWPELKRARAALADAPKTETTGIEGRATVFGLLFANFVLTVATAAIMAVPLLVAGLHPRDVAFWVIYGPIIGLLLALDVWVVVRVVRALRACAHG
jgi:hypothetical protein